MAEEVTDEDIPRRAGAAPYNSTRPVPTVQRYEREQELRNGNAPHATSDEEAKRQTDTNQDDVEKAGTYLGPSEEPHSPGDQGSGGGRLKEKGQHLSDRFSSGKADSTEASPTPTKEAGREQSSQQKTNGQAQSGPQATIAEAAGPKEKRKQLQHLKRDHKEREVTDPVTHLPVTIHDVSAQELEHVPENLLPGTSADPALKSAGQKDQQHQYQNDTSESRQTHADMEKLFPSPAFESARSRMTHVNRLAQMTSVTLILGGGYLMTKTFGLVRPHLHTDGEAHTALSRLSISVYSVLLVSGLGVWTAAVLWLSSHWLESNISKEWKDAVWEAESQRNKDIAEAHQPESTEWLNSVLSSVWQLINPDLFTSLADTLEDVMQASLPRMVRMISVDDLGQGNEALRILGIRWLPAAAAASSVSVSGNIEAGGDDGKAQKSDRTVPGEGEVKDSPDNNQDDNKDGDEDVAEGMEGEEGDFINLEVAFSYRARSAGKSFKSRAKNAHLYLAFYLFGGIKFPVWVDLRGIAGTMRLRLQLTPDPPFFALCTLTFLGQPKADLSCIPLTRKGLNIMDLPIISGFVQSSLDAALAEYVAPKSLTIDLKDMIVGDDVKKDTIGRGVIAVNIKRAFEFKEGDSGFMGLTKGSSDAYVTVGWSKFGKSLWSTRIILDSMTPIWDETAFILVGPQELNAGERLKIQLWDSDRTTADDNLGQIEVDLKELMQSSETKATMHDRRDRLKGVDGNESMPGEIEWSVGYFGKIRLLPEQYSQQKADADIKSREQLEERVTSDAQQKLREATYKDESEEVSQQKAQDLHDKEVEMTASAPPPAQYPSGILSIQIHQITGLGREQVRKTKTSSDSADDQDGDDLPSSYCTVIVNQQPRYRTRTKPKNPNPFFNAGTERFIRDWRSTQVIISVRDARVHEDDPLLGVVSIPLLQTFKDKAQIDGGFPLAGGIGYGRVKISVVFRAVKLQVPQQLLGWEYGTLSIPSNIEHKDLPDEYQSLRLKLRTSIGKGKMSPSNGSWSGKKGRVQQVAVQDRYSSCFVIEFRKNQLGKDKTTAFAVLWLKDITDDEDRTIEMPVWKGDETLVRARTSCEADLGERIGTLRVPLKFERGLGRFHSKIISKDPTLQDVSEALQCLKEMREGEGVSDSDDESGSSQSGSDHGTDNGKEAELQNSGHRGPLDQIRDYQEHKSELHRRHRGVMQWKGPRTARWLRTKVEHGKDHIAANFQHRGRDTGIETEA